MTNASPYPTLPQAWGIFGLYIGFSLGIGLFIGIIYELTGLNNIPLANLLGYTITGILILLFVWIKKRTSEPGEALVHFGTMPVSISFLILLLTISTVITIDPLSNLIPMPEIMEEIFGLILQKSVFNLVLLVIIGPIIEEILLRGVILDGFLRRYSPFKSIFWSSLIFGLLHLNPWQFIGALIIGLLMGYIYWKTRSLITCIFIHMVNNGIAYLLSYLYDSEIVTFAELFDSRRDYLIVYFMSIGMTLLLFLTLQQVLTRQKENVWKNGDSSDF